MDGDKRTAFATTLIFLRPNGPALPLAPAEGVRMMEGPASSRTTEARLVQWFASGTAPL